jgi:hypothetical protein
MKKLDTCEGRWDKINMNLKYVKKMQTATQILIYWTDVVEEARSRQGTVLFEVTCSYINSQTDTRRESTKPAAVPR